jgi:hypothetical protein
MPNFKNISVRVPGRENIYKVRISSTMNEDGIYHALQSGLRSVMEAGEITITNPDRNNVKVYLHYSHLKQGQIYNVSPALLRVQGAGTLGSAAVRVVVLINDILRYWGLNDTSDILPPDIAPPVSTPHEWSAKFTAALHKLAAHTKNKHALGIELMRAQIARRNAAAEVTTSDLKYAAVKAWDMLSEDEKVEYRSAQPSTTLQDDEDTALFAGELGDAAEEALEEGEEGADVGWEYQEEGPFHIALR